MKTGTHSAVPLMRSYISTWNVYPLESSDGTFVGNEHDFSQWIDTNVYVSSMTLKRRNLQ